MGFVSSYISADRTIKYVMGTGVSSFKISFKFWGICLQTCIMYKVIDKKLKYENLNYNVFTDYCISYMNSHKFRKYYMFIKNFIIQVRKHLDILQQSKCNHTSWVTSRYFPVVKHFIIIQTQQHLWHFITFTNIIINVIQHVRDILRHSQL